MKKQYHGFRSFLAQPLENYMNGKRAIGYKYTTEELALQLWDKYLVETNIQHITAITTETLESFLMSRNRGRPRSYNHLLCVIRCFIKWFANQEELTHVFHLPMSRRTTSQRLPFIFNDEQAAQLLKVTAQLPDNSRAKHRGHIYSVIFSLLYNLGLRVGEVSRLRIKDVDMNQKLLVICQTKFNKDRYVPFGSRLTELLKNYLEWNQDMRIKEESPLFTFDGCEFINPCTISMVFHNLIPQLGLIIPPGVSPPRLHDLRHSFSVNTLLRWYHSGIDPGQKLIHLSTFLGHVDPVTTAVYLQITHSLLDAANHRFEQYSIDLLKETENEQ